MTPRVAIAHEWLVSYAGSERCVEQMLEVFPDADLLTTIVDRSAVPEPLRRARPSWWLQRVPGSRGHHEWFVPLMPLAWRTRRRLKDVDVVISSSHSCAKAVRVAPGIPHVCYCHTPMYYAWDFEAEQERFPARLRPLVKAGMGWYRRWDRRTAERVTKFVAISTVVARRIERAYSRPSQVIHPPVRTDFFSPGGERGDAFLYAGRLVPYKRPDLVIDTFAGLPYRLQVVGDGPARAALEARATANVEFLGWIDDPARLRDLYRSARAFIHPGAEHFGIAMVEALACGTPVIALAAGGALDIVDPGATGWLIEREDVEALRAAVRRAAAEELDSSAIVRSAQRFSSERFRRELRAVVEAQLESR